jgi:hypothetical protein
MDTQRSIAGAWAGGILVTLLLAAGAPLAVWPVLALLLAFAVALAPSPGRLDR